MKNDKVTYLRIAVAASHQCHSRDEGVRCCGVCRASPHKCLQGVRYCGVCRVLPHKCLQGVRCDAVSRQQPEGDATARQNWVVLPDDALEGVAEGSQVTTFTAAL